MENTSFYNYNELSEFGFGSLGSNVLISRKASIYTPHNIAIGDNVRVDDFCILSGNVQMGSFIHISAYTAIFGGETGVYLDDYTTISSRCAIYAESDDYTGEYMTNPMLPDAFRGVIKGKVHISKHGIIGTGCTVLPGVTVGEGCSVGAMSLVNKSLFPWGVYVGIPCRLLRERKRELLQREAEFEKMRK